ncbi:GntR family transcriptional regulator [Streptomyces sp. NBC_01549]|uniref:GntR family transcriptional regulator n=1 Tax=Streptomyces sp. NBC_01549 TaxID=2975874 RepID=UPI002259150A|nr:GntR family transcriptional regulator [Streptomyces sp. NBC_01549]MCX4588239.1 GntR family transcriptional regulator [Streptomyces sp. NBC_01549]
MNEVLLKYHRITEALAKEIRSGTRPVGERLPGEHALAERFGVSRTTVRSALAELNEAGLIATRAGEGSYVLFDGRPLDGRLGWAHALADQGIDTRVRTLAVTEEHDERLAARLGLSEALFVCVERTRELLADGAVVSYERSFLPPVPGVRELLSRAPADGESLTDIMLRAGLRSDHGEQRLAGRRIDVREAELLRRRQGDWFLDTRLTSRAADGSLVEHVVSLLDPDHFQVALEFG